MLILIGSVTTAARFARAAERILGSPAAVMHTPPALNKGGCSYAVRIADRYAHEAAKIAKENGIAVKKMYSEDFINGERVYNALSG